MRVTSSSCSVVTNFTTRRENKGGFRSRYTVMCSAIDDKWKKEEDAKMLLSILKFLASELATTASKCVG